jgi:transposase
MMAEEKRVVRQYPMAFKLDAVKLVLERGYSVAEAAASLGIPQTNLVKWRKQYREGRLLAGHHRAQPTAEEAELRQLKAEVKRLEMELAIVKKAAIYFAKQTS